jgi:hypothetical protein
VNERFLYEYDSTDGWEHQVRIEQFVPPEQRQPYSVCVGGSRAAPPEDCGGPVAFQQRREKTPWQARELVNQIAERVAKREVTALRDLIDELATLKEWLLLDKFDRRMVNRRLRQHAAGDDEWRWQ